jgi:hypothetical protein
MAKYLLPIDALLTNNARPFDVTHALADILRNIPNITRFKGSLVPMVPPMGGRPMEAAMMEFINFLSLHFLTTLTARQSLKRGSLPPSRGKGERFDFDVWLRSSALILKVAQAELSCSKRDRISLVNRYLARHEAGRYQSEQGVDKEALKKWRKKFDGPRRGIWTKDTAALLLSLYLPENFHECDAELQHTHLVNLAPWAKEYFTKFLGDKFPVEFFTLFLDFSQHTPSEMRNLVAALQDFCSLPRIDRYQKIAAALSPVICNLADLFSDVEIHFTQSFVPTNAPI